MKHLLRDVLEAAAHPYATIIHLRFILGGKAFRSQRNVIRKDFDEKFYLEAYPFVRRRKVGPLQHFIVVGWREGKDPHEGFNVRAYLSTYQDVADAGVNPFVHYVKHGRKEGRVAQVSAARRRTAARPTAPLKIPPIPAPAEWAALPKKRVEPVTREAVDVIVPVYKSLPHVAATLRSVLAARCETLHDVVVVDDCTPEPGVAALLTSLSESGHIRLIRNPQNLGFVESCNKAMAVSPHRDVVLLNADTIVYDGWLDRLAAPVKRDADIATVTPLSNNATLASYPDVAYDNSFELEVDGEALDGLIAAANAGRTVDVPTGVGFCFYIRRAALRSIGLFDAKTFGMGYGEETDFCMRALKAGWRNVLAMDVYVRHFGSMSFGTTMTARHRKADVRMARKHPDYDGRVRRHFAADPTLPARMTIDAARIARWAGGVSVLFISHSRGGGVETFLKIARQALRADGLGHVVDRAVLMQFDANGGISLASFGDAQLPYTPNLQPLQIDRHKVLLADLIAILSPELIHVNSFAGLPQATTTRLMDAIVASGRPYWHVWHDHQPLCPRLNFLDHEENYCGETNASLCPPCLSASRAEAEWVDIETWRERFRAFLAGAEVVSAPSESAALRARRMVDAGKVKVHPHPQPFLDTVTPMARRDRDGVLRVLILGAIGPHKGANLIYALIKDAETRDLPIKFEIVGYTSERRIRTGAKATVHGPYNGDDDAARRIHAIAPDLFFASSVWPETFSFILSVAIGLRLPIVTFDLGAPAQRVTEYRRGIVLLRRLIEDPCAVNDALLALDMDALWAVEPQADGSGVSALSEHFQGRDVQAAPPHMVAEPAPVTPLRPALDAGEGARLVEARPPL